MEQEKKHQETPTEMEAQQEKQKEKKKKKPAVCKEEELNNQLNELNDKYLRLFAEYDNFRKRTLRERADLLKTASEDIIISLLPLMDDFERALKSMETASDIEAVKEGVSIIYTKFKNNLTQKGVEAIQSVGSEFNTDLHEAITNIPAPSEEMKGKVVDEIEKGYLLNGKVIRFAKVVVGQ